MSHTTRGSTWRRWDLHVHTPASPFAEFGQGDAAWSAFASAIASAARAHNIAAICLSDYFTFDGYEQLIGRRIYDPEGHTWKSEEDEVPMSVIPGIELRLSQLTEKNHAINLHVLFDPARISVARLRTDFLAQLTLAPKQGNVGMTLSRAHLLALGKAQGMGGRPDLGEDLSGLSEAEQVALLSAALKVATVSQDNLLATLKTLDESLGGGRGYLVAVAGSGHGSLSELPWEGHAAAVRESVLWDSDLFFSPSKSDREFLLGRHKDTPVEECLKRFRTLKPCVWGSDAKKLDAVLHPSNGNTDRYTWVKADCSFEGLKQLLYEPADRVTIQEPHPDQRPWNSIIDTVRFLDDAGHGEVSEEWIEINPSLTTIIGGKSSGKSLLLHFIAKTIDPAQVRDRHGDDEPYDRIEQDVSFEVRWKNGDIQTLGGAEVAPSRITYLPQNYINRLAEPDSQDQLEGVILRLLREDDSFAAAEDDLRASVAQDRSTIAEQVQRLFEIRRQADGVLERISDLGKAEAIQEEIDRLKEEQEEIRKSAGMSPNEEEDFAALRGRREELEGQAQQLRAEETELKELEQALPGIRRRVAQELIPFLGAEEEGAQVSAGVRRVAGELTQALTRAFHQAQQNTVQIRAEVTADAGKVDEDLAGVDTALEPYQAKLSSRARADALAEAEAKQRKQLLQIEEEEKRLARLRRRLSDGISRIMDAYRQVHSAHEAFIAEFLGGGGMDIAGDVRLIAETSFDASAFAAQLFEGLDGRQKFDNIEGLSYSVDGYSYPGTEQHWLNVEAMLTDLTTRESARTLKLKKSYSPLDVAMALARDRYRLHLSLQHAGDDLQRMSPGKRGMVLLRLLLEKSGATHPILIDQPEDNLDNRTVFSQLRHAVRDRKSQRQILMVTHNANLVVSTDSECVLVAHQYGPGEKPVGLPRFEYRGGALEHTRPPAEDASVLATKGTREHVCEVLEGGEEAFLDRQRKYEFSPS